MEPTWSDVKAVLDDPSVPADTKSTLITSWQKEHASPLPFLPGAESDEEEQEQKEADRYSQEYGQPSALLKHIPSVEDAYGQAKKDGDTAGYDERQEAKAVSDGKTDLDGLQPPADGGGGTKTSDELFDAAQPALKVFSTFGSLLATIPDDCRGVTRPLTFDTDIQKPFDEQRGISFTDFMADAAHFRTGSTTVSQTSTGATTAMGTLLQSWTGPAADAASDSYQNQILDKATTLAKTLGTAADATAATTNAVFQLCKGKAEAVIDLYTDQVGKADFTMAQRVVAVANGDHAGKDDIAAIAGWMDMNFGTNLVRALNDDGCCDGDEIRKQGVELAKQWIQNQFNPDLWDRLYQGFVKICKDCHDLVDQAYDTLDETMGRVRNEFEGTAQPGQGDTPAGADQYSNPGGGAGGGPGGGSGPGGSGPGGSGPGGSGPSGSGPSGSSPGGSSPGGSGPGGSGPSGSGPSGSSPGDSSPGDSSPGGSGYGGDASGPGHSATDPGGTGGGGSVPGGGDSGSTPGGGSDGGSIPGGGPGGGGSIPGGGPGGGGSIPGGGPGGGESGGAGTPPSIPPIPDGSDGTGSGSDPGPGDDPSTDDPSSIPPIPDGTDGPAAPDGSGPTGPDTTAPSGLDPDPGAGPADPGDAGPGSAFPPGDPSAGNPETVKVVQGGRTFEMTAPGPDGRMDVKVGDGPGAAEKDFKLDWDGANQPPVTQPGSDPAGAPGSDGSYHPGADGRIHIKDGDLDITAERPDGPGGPTTVTVDDGTSSPTTYTLAEPSTPDDPAAGPDSGDGPAGATAGEPPSQEPVTLSAPGAGPSDTAPPDTAPPDAVPSDTGPSDSAPPDTGPSDTAPTDTGLSDTAPPDTALSDAAPPDTAPPDNGPPDAGPPDTALTDANHAADGATDPGAAATADPGAGDRAEPSVPEGVPEGVPAHGPLESAQDHGLEVGAGGPASGGGFPVGGGDPGSPAAPSSSDLQPANAAAGPAGQQPGGMSMGSPGGGAGGAGGGGGDHERGARAYRIAGDALFEPVGDPRTRISGSLDDE